MLKPNMFYEVIENIWSDPRKGGIFLCLGASNEDVAFPAEHPITVLYKNKICTWYLTKRDFRALKEIE